MTQALEPTYTTNNQRVLAIEKFRQQGNSTRVTATVEDWENEGFVMEYSCTYNLDDLRLLDGAEPALKAFQEKRMDDEEDEEDGTFHNCLGSVLSCIKSFFASTIPVNRIEDVPQCKRGTPDTQLPAFSNEDSGKHVRIQTRLERLILRSDPNGSYQCKQCGASFSFPEVYMFHIQKHRKAVTSSDTPTSCFESSGTTDYIRSSAAQTTPPSLDTQSRLPTRLLTPSLNSTYSQMDLKIMRCFVLKIAASENGVYAKLLAEAETEHGMRILRLKENDWEAVEGFWGMQLKEHVGEIAYDMAMRVPRVGNGADGAELDIFAAQQNLSDIGLSSEHCEMLLNGGELHFSGHTEVLDIPWICKSL